MTDPDTYDCIGGIGAYSNNGVSYINCANYGTITFSNETAYAGGICGYVNNNSFTGLFNCLNTGTVKMSSGTPTYSGALIGRLRTHANARFDNNFWLNGSAVNAYGENTAEATAVDAERLASGEICYALNGDQTEINWFQTLGEDPYPVLDPSHLQVWRTEESTYVNENPDGIATIEKTPLTFDHAVYDLSGRKVKGTLLC